MLHQDIDHLQVSSGTGSVEGGPAFNVSGINVSIVLKKQLRQLLCVLNAALGGGGGGRGRGEREEREGEEKEGER